MAMSELRSHYTSLELPILRVRTLFVYYPIHHFIFSLHIGHNLSEVVRVCIIPYLAEEHAIVRQTAALTACTLIAVDPVCFQTSDYSVGILMSMLDRLLTLAVADQGVSEIHSKSVWNWCD
jgi:hypothetical protein